MTSTVSPRAETDTTPPGTEIPPGDAPAGFDPTEALRALCRSVADVVAITASPPSRVSVSVGHVRLEAEWPVAGGVAHVVAVPTDGDGRTPVAGTTGTTAGVAAGTAAGGETLAAPLVGTFYRAPEPGAASFAEVGDVVRAGDQVGIIEAMKLMNPIVAERAGRITAFLVDDAEPVEYGQPLMAFEPLDEE